MIYSANDKYYTELTQAYNPGDTTIYLVTPPDNVPTILCLAKGTSNETIFTVTGKTANSITGCARLKGANVELIIQTPVTCLNNQEFINQYQTEIAGLFTIPAGGTTGQVLKKTSATDNDTEWGSGVPAGGTTGQVLKKASDADNDIEWGSAGLDTLQVVLSSQVFS